MLITTKVLVLNALKYSESSLIVKCYTKDYGSISYILKGILKTRKGNLKPSFFQPLNILEIVASHRNKNTLEYIKEAKVSYHYQSIHFDMVKNAQAYFLADICRTILSEEPQNSELFEFLESEFLHLDSYPYSANFHLEFLIELTKFLGFYPGLPENHHNCFYIEKGIYSDYPLENKNIITEKNYTNFIQIIKNAKGHTTTEKISREERLELLEIILSYYKWHLPEFDTPKSLAILQSLFG